MKILLTGASGMLGKNIQEHSGASVHEWLTPSHGDLDLSNYASVYDYIEKHVPEVVIHAAGRVGGIQANLREPVNFLVENLDMGRNVVLAASRIGVKKLVNIGSSCMYPKDHQGSLVEEDVLNGRLEPTNEGYALAKITTARLAAYVRMQDSSFEYVTVIPSNLYGRHDKFDPRWSHLIPAILYKLHQAKVNNENAVEIWGDGTARREFLYCADLAGALLQVVENVSDVPPLMNIGQGIDHSVNDFYHAAAEVVGYRGDFVHDLSKPVGMKQKLTDVSKAKNWGWSATTDLRQGLSKTYQFYLDSINGK